MNSGHLQNCIESCQHCHDTCLQSAMTHCLQEGGPHVEAKHFRLMLNCADICQAAANFMLGESHYHAAICGVCADICDACANSCETVGDMGDCVDACRSCAEQCRAMPTAAAKTAPASGN